MHTDASPEPLQGPLTSADIVRIEQGINELLSEVIPPGNSLRRALALDLRAKISVYMALLSTIKADADAPNAPEAVDALRELLALVEAYYQRFK